MADAKTVDDDIKVDIIDDTPPADRGKEPMPKEVVEEIEKDNLEEYSEKVRTRISQLKKTYHDERREKEAALREREEALAFARSQMELASQLKQRLTAGEKVFVTEVTKGAESEMKLARENLKKAYEDGDAGKIAEAQEAMTEAKMKLREFQNFRPALQNENNGVEQQVQTRAPAQPKADPKAIAWRDRNQWFGQNEEMTALALGLHERLVRAGVDPTSEDYYKRVDETMRKRFPEEFSDEESVDVTHEKPPTAAQRKNNTVVAPATRSTAPRKVTLTASQAAIAKRLGVSAEAYARELMKQESNNV